MVFNMINNYNNIMKTLLLFILLFVPVICLAQATTVPADMEKTVKEWGGHFEFKMAIPWSEILQKMKNIVTIVHLTMYGENIENSKVMKEIKKRGCDVLVIVGSRKVPAEFYSISDFNVAVGNQPHSEVAALSIFLDRYFEGTELLRTFERAQKRIIPSSRQKRLKQ